MSQHRSEVSYRSGPEPAPDRSTLGRSKRPRAIFATLAAVAALTVVLAAVATAKGSPPARAEAAWQKPDTLQAGDRRCLTRRPEDCLAKPVPADEPHGAVCGVCHDLWTGRPAKQTARSCSGGECHAHPETLTPFHRTVDPKTLSQCTECHRAHDFRVADQGKRCGTCHEAGGEVASWATPPAPLELAPGLVFDHDDHPGVACEACHGSGAAHTTLKLRTIEDCRGCHHTPPESDDCTGCHVVDEVRTITARVTRTMDIQVGSLDGPRRTLVFDHAKHWRTNCSVCHSGRDMRTADKADCSGCHLNHHDPTADCSACHEAPAFGAHTRTAHLGCGGTGCHDPLPAAIRGAPRTRQLCLACHRDMVQHEPGRVCVDCHILPPPSEEPDASGQLTAPLRP